MSAVRIISVFPELLGTYGDVGNVTVLERRLAWRGIDAEVVTVGVEEPLPRGGDIYVFGGSEDDNQARALVALRSSHLLDTVAGGAHLFAVCAGLQMLGRTVTGLDGVRVEGLGLLDAETSRIDKRVVGEVVAVAEEVVLPPLTGFANHGGGTVLGPAARPLGRTIVGRGNEGTTGGPEGAVQGTVVATYLHGPVLARNPAFADWLLERVTGLTLEPLPAGPAEALHDTLVRAQA
jgi:CobQ-like glutamine amidotransferase family enzyme